MDEPHRWVEWFVTLDAGLLAVLLLAVLAKGSSPAPDEERARNGKSADHARNRNEPLC